MTGERHVEGHLVVYGSVSLSLGTGGASPFFKVEGQERVAFGKRHGILVGFRHVRFDDFHQPTTLRNIVNVLRFKMRHLVRSILDFPQKIGDLVADHPTGADIAVHEQGARRSEFFRGMKLGIQIHHEPIATHAQLEILSVHAPKRRSIQGIGDIRGVGNGIRAKFLDDIGSQTKHVRGGFHEPSHSQGQQFPPFHFGHLTRVIHIRGVQAQIPVLGPLEEGVQLDAIGLGQLALGDDALGSGLVVTSHEGFEKLLPRRQQVLGGHLIAQEGEFSALMVVVVVVGVQHALVPSHVQEGIHGGHKRFSHGRNVGQRHTDQSDLPIGAHEPNGTRQPVFETVGFIGGKLGLVVFTHERHVERMRRGERHGRFLFRVFFFWVVARA